MKPELSSYYERGKRRIILITSIVALLGFAFELATYFQVYNPGLKIIGVANLVVLVSVLAVHLTKRVPSSTIFLVMSWYMLLSISVSQTFYPEHAFFGPLLELVVVRNLLYLVCIIALTGFIGTTRHLIYQTVWLAGLICFSAFVLHSTFVQKNLVVILIVSLGFLSIIYYIARHLHQFIELIHDQNALLEERNDEIVDNITYAKRLQDAIMPSDKYVQECFEEVFVFYRPKDIVAGDFYWFIRFQNHIYFAVADCTGHGVSGAIVSVICHEGLTRSVMEYGLTDPGEILNKTRELVIKQFEQSDINVQDGMDIALCEIEASKRKSTEDGLRLRYAGAYNPLWIFRKQAPTQPQYPVEKLSDGQVVLEEVPADKKPIGKHHDDSAFSTHEVTLHTGDTIYLFSDGFADQFGGEKGKKYKYHRLKECLASVQNLSMNEQHTALEKEFDDWKGELEQVDDISLLGIRI